MQIRLSKALIFAAFLLNSCAHKGTKEAEKAMHLVSTPKSLQDDLGWENFEGGLKSLIKYHRRKNRKLRFGQKVINSFQYANALQKLVECPAPQREQYLKKNFSYLRIHGSKHAGKAFMTAYFEPVIEASTKRTSKFSQAILRRPKDLIKLDISKWQLDDLQKTNHTKRTLRARLTKKNSKPHVVPYPNREEMTKLQYPKNEIIGWADPIDLFFAQIQGSTTIKIPGQKAILLGYHDANGRPYRAIGKDLFHVIPKKEMTLAKIEKHLRQLSPAQAQKILNKNQSFVFFKKLKNIRPQSSTGTSVVDGRSIATDSSLFPKGALGFLEFPQSMLTINNKEALAKKQSSRFVFDQDIGGAIKGSGRLDLFIGKGLAAKNIAGQIKDYGTLYYLFPKSKLTNRKN